MKSWKLLILTCVIAIYGIVAVPITHAMSILIPGAHSVETKYYDDLTTNNPDIGSLAESSRASSASNNWTSDGKPVRPDWYTPKVKVPGMQIAGMFDDSKFVIRIPEKWNGKLIVGAAMGFRNERAMDAMLSDYMLTKFDANGASYAYAYTDKGTAGEVIPSPNGKLTSRTQTALAHPDDTLEEWHMRMHQLTVAVKDLLVRQKGKAPDKTYISGCSNGGYVTRYALEHDGDLYDGGIDWEGGLWGKDINFITGLIDTAHNWKILHDPLATAEAKAKARVAYGFPVESDFLGKYYEDKKIWVAWFDVLTLKFDPSFNKQHNVWDYKCHPDDYDNYIWSERPQEVREALSKIENTGNIKKPLISVAGTWDVHVNPATNEVGYKKIVESSGRSSIYRQYLIDHGNHLDGLVGNPKVDKDKQLQAVFPYYHQAIDLLIDWVENNNLPPANKTIPMPDTYGKVISITTGQEIDPY